jgi:hypothetical protein
MEILGLLTSRRARNAFRTKRFLAAAPKCSDLQGRIFDKAIVATVAFNRPDMVEWQIHLVRKYMAERDGYIVFDNSSDSSKRADLRELCAREKVPYVSLPRLTIGKNSFSHAAAMNWITRNFVASRQPTVFGFLDHDIFPVEPFSIRERIAGKKVYGLRHSHQDAWYLWAGFCFFSNVLVESLDFDPVPPLRLDTGGGNWSRLYRTLSADDVAFAVHRREESTTNGRDIEIMDGWLHAGNASGWNDGWSGDRGPIIEARLRSAAGAAGPNISLGPI